MKTTEIINQDAMNDRRLAELVDQMDPAIGEASTVMGAMATEMIRRALRGGVLTIGRELSGYVTQQVEQEIVEQRPLIEKAAAETATEVARGEVEAVRQATNEQGQQLAGRIEDASRQALAQFETVTKVIDETSRKANEATTSLAQTLQQEVSAVETRTLDTARKEFSVEIDAFKERARQATARIKDRLDKLDATSAELADLQRALKSELVETLRREQRQLHGQIDELRSANQALAERLGVLERPRGLRRLFAWLFGKNKKTAASEATVSTEETNEDHPAPSAKT